MDKPLPSATRLLSHPSQDVPPPNFSPAAYDVLLRALRMWWRNRVIGGIERAEVLARIEAEGGWTARYAFMTLMSAGIAVLGLLLSSPAVVIGAMLISPLMGPILALGFALATFDWREVRQSLFALLGGSLLAILFTALIVALSPLTSVTTEILARTRPNLFDLLVAIFSALAGAYAVMRGRGETVVGVAIATALMPPLAVVGFGLATLNGPVFAGSLALFVTNAVAIAVSAAIMARLHGFGSELSPRQTRLQATLIVTVLALFAIPLALALKQIAWEAVAATRVRAAIERHFGPDARVSQLDFQFEQRPLGARAVVITPRYEADAAARLSKELEPLLDRPIRLQLQQLVTDQDLTPLAREREAMVRARQAADRVSDEASEIAQALVLVTGAGEDAVAADSQRRQAVVRPSGPAGMRDLMRWQAEEARIAAEHAGWTIEVIPPAGTPLFVPFAESSSARDPGAAAILNTVRWTLDRWNVRSASVIGRAASDEPAPAALARARAETVANALALAGVTTETETDPPGPIQTRREQELGTRAFRHVEVRPSERLSPAAGSLMP